MEWRKAKQSGKHVENQTEKTAQIDVSLAFLHFLPLLRLLRTWVYAHDMMQQTKKDLLNSFLSLISLSSLSQIRHIPSLPLLPRLFSLPGSTCRYFWGREDVSLCSSPNHPHRVKGESRARKLGYVICLQQSPKEGVGGFWGENPPKCPAKITRDLELGKQNSLKM